MMTAAYFQCLARYNQWANRLLYDAVKDLSREAFNADRSVFFGSLRGTLNHLLVADRVWMARFTGEGDAPGRLDVILHEDLEALSAARRAEDTRIIALADQYTDEDVAAVLEFRNMAGESHAIPLALALGHFFNHQTHHRGHCHAMLSQAGHTPPQLDLIYFLREL